MARHGMACYAMPCHAMTGHEATCACRLRKLGTTSWKLGDDAGHRQASTRTPGGEGGAPYTSDMAPGDGGDSLPLFFPFIATPNLPRLFTIPEPGGACRGHCCRGRQAPKFFPALRFPAGSISRLGRDRLSAPGRPMAATRRLKRQQGALVASGKDKPPGFYPRGPCSCCPV